ncbi:Protoheme IX farnesyltransferase, mitochondrial [Amphibalanus amphitrite]|uniref:Protoheme IX farnesyltransferase, mitochondrial n=1 Tax=Amphibalanus amphitrite TaxID=1232801 RepID=A0A6A4WAV1_AMPAM|nr:Protoheme IX farnesyltransferase, mitochondrial [Amphibalanus amphitrite]
MSGGLLAPRGLSCFRVGHHPSLLLIASRGHSHKVTLRCFSLGRQQQMALRLLLGRTGLTSGITPCVAVLPTHAGTQAARVSTFSALWSSERGPQRSRPPVSDLVVKPRDLDWRSTALDWSSLHRRYMELAKVRLTGLVVVTAMAGYAMAPGAFSGTTLALVAGGTLLTSSAANTVNQWLEVPYDSQMARTAARPLVRGHVSPLAAALGAANFLLYTAVYTPLKRVTIANTWVGAVVGGVPPLMGWAAATGSLAPGAWLLAGLLYAWQFPHFNALSWNLRKDYARAGYRIMAVTHPDLTRRVALRYSLMLAALPFVTSACDVTSWMYAVDSLPVNAYLVYLAWRFSRDRDSGSARRLTRFSYVQLTAGLILMLLAKQHYHLSEPEPEAEAGAVTAAAGAERRGRGKMADWCIGEPLLQRGWGLGGILAVAEREEGGRENVSSREERVSSSAVGAEEESSSPRDGLVLLKEADLAHEDDAVISEDRVVPPSSERPPSQDVAT